MPFQRPSLAELRARSAGEVASRLGLSALLPRSVLEAWAWTFATGRHFLHAHLDFLARQHFPQTAEIEGVLRWAELKHVTRKAATFAEGAVGFSGQEGAVVPAGARLARADGVTYVTIDDVTIDPEGVGPGEVMAEAAGAAGDCPAGTALALQSAIAGVASSATVGQAGVLGGADAESDESLRARVIEAWQNPVLGGAQADWVTWTLEVAGVTRAWCRPLAMGPSTVGVTFTVDDAPYGPIPAVQDVTAVRQHLEARRPVGCQLFVFAPLAQPLDFTLQLTPDTAAVRAAVEASLADLLRREAEPGGTLLLSHVREAISLATGEVDHVLTDPTADVTTTLDRLSTMGTVSYA